VLCCWRWAGLWYLPKAQRVDVGPECVNDFATPCGIKILTPPHTYAETGAAMAALTAGRCTAMMIT